MGLYFDTGMTHESAFRALVGLSVGQQVFRQIIFSDESFIAVRTRKIPRSVSRLVFPQSAVFAKSLVAKSTRVRRLFRMRSVMSDQFGLVSQNSGAFATGLDPHVILTMILQTGRVVEFLVANSTLCFRSFRRMVIVVIIVVAFHRERSRQFFGG